MLCCDQLHKLHVQYQLDVLQKASRAGCSPCSHVKRFAWLLTTELSCCFAA